MKIRHCVAVSVGAWCLLAWNGPRAQGQSEFPEPAPTNAVQTLQKALIVEGVGSVPLGGDPEASEQQAYQAAVLDAYQQLFWQGAEHVVVLAWTSSTPIWLCSIGCCVPRSCRSRSSEVEFK